MLQDEQWPSTLDSGNDDTATVSDKPLHKAAPEITTESRAALSGMGVTATIAERHLRALCTAAGQLVSRSGISCKISCSRSLPCLPAWARLAECL